MILSMIEELGASQKAQGTQDSIVVSDSCLEGSAKSERYRLFLVLKLKELKV
jgi:hypothetical protein